MNKVEIGKERIYNAEFAKRGVQNVVKWDIFPVLNDEIICVTFEQIKSESKSS